MTRVAEIRSLFTPRDAIDGHVTERLSTDRSHTITSQSCEITRFRIIRRRPVGIAIDQPLLISPRENMCQGKQTYTCC